MTDNEIIKALDYCKDCYANINIDIIDLINRKQAEIEKLQKNQDDIDNFARYICKERMLKGKLIANFDDLQEYIRKEKAEAIKEFAERLKSSIYIDTNLLVYQCEEVESVIDDIVKEMVGETNDT